MESIKIYTKTVSLLNKMKKYLREPNVDKLFIDLNKMDAQTAGELKAIIYLSMRKDKINTKMEREFYSDSTIKFKTIDKVDPNISAELKKNLIDFIIKRTGEIGNIISHVE